MNERAVARSWSRRSPVRPDVAVTNTWSSRSRPSKSARTDASDATSTTASVTPSSGDRSPTGRRPAATTEAPRAAAARAVARPMPLVPPTTTTVRPARASPLTGHLEEGFATHAAPGGGVASLGHLVPRAAPADLRVEGAGGGEPGQVR